MAEDNKKEKRLKINKGNQLSKEDQIEQNKIITNNNERQNDDMFKLERDAIGVEHENDNKNGKSEIMVQCENSEKNLEDKKEKLIEENILLAKIVPSKPHYILPYKYGNSINTEAIAQMFGWKCVWEMTCRWSSMGTKYLYIMYHSNNNSKHIKDTNELVYEEVKSFEPVKKCGIRNGEMVHIKICKDLVSEEKMYEREQKYKLNPNYIRTYIKDVVYLKDQTDNWKAKRVTFACKYEVIEYVKHDYVKPAYDYEY